MSCWVSAHPQVSHVTKGVNGEAWESFLIQDNMICYDLLPQPVVLFGVSSCGILGQVLCFGPESLRAYVR